MAVNAQMVGLITAFNADIQEIQSIMEKGVFPNNEKALAKWNELEAKMAVEYAPLAEAYQDMAGAGLPHVPALQASIAETIRLGDVIAEAGPNIFPTRSADLAAMAQVTEDVEEIPQDVEVSDALSPTS